MKGEKIKIYLDPIEGKVTGTLIEDYGNNRWLVKCGNTNVVRIVKNGSYKQDGCGYKED